jgi:ubiquitin C-terminal hydrolase
MEPCGGLANLGATCYLNTAVQCLGYCKVFLRFVLDNKEKYKSPGLNLFDALAILYEDLWVNKKSVLPRRFVGQVELAIPVLDIYNQNDINEFLLCFIDKLNTSIAKKLDPPSPKLLAKGTSPYETEK